MQAIKTRVVPFTNHRPTYILATCERGSIRFSTTHLTVQLGSEEAHRAAASALCAKFCKEDEANYGTQPANNSWARDFVSGSLNGYYVHVFIK